jgi:hypothetical protein
MNIPAEDARYHGSLAINRNHMVFGKDFYKDYVNKTLS